MTDVAARFPLTAQQRWTRLRSWLPPSTHRNWCTVPIPPGLSDVDVATVVAALVDRHEALRGTVTQVGDAAYRSAAGPVPVLVVADLSAWLGDEVERPADAGSWVRFALQRDRDGTDVLAVVVEELAADCWSMAVLRAELVDLLAGVELPPAPELQYGDYAAWQRDCADAGLLDAGIRHWVELLATARRPPFPVLDAAAVRAGQDRFAVGGSTGLVLAGPALDRLRRTAARHRVSLYMTAVAAVGLLLHGLGATGEVVVESGAANRDAGDVPEVVGAFHTPVFLPVVAAADPVRVLAAVREAVLTAHEHLDAHPVAVIAAEPRFAWLADHGTDLVVRFQFVPSTEATTTPWAEPLVHESGAVPADLQVVVHDLGAEVATVLRVGGLLASVLPVEALADRWRRAIDALSDVDAARPAVR